jgi:hypothetical protein
MIFMGIGMGVAFAGMYRLQKAARIRIQEKIEIVEGKCTMRGQVSSETVMRLLGEGSGSQRAEWKREKMGKR